METGPSPLAHLPVLDEVRGVAFLLVFLFHNTEFVNDEMGGWYLYLRALARTAWCGVDLFFVLSGLLITRILLNAKTQPNYFRNFYGRRVLRIFPLYYATLALYTLAIGLLHLRSWSGLASASWLWTYSSNLAIAWRGWRVIPTPLHHLWSLAIEEQFYLFWPLVVMLSSERALLRICAVTFFGAAALRVGFVLSGNIAGTYVFTLCRSDALVAGAAIAVLMGRGSAVPPERLISMARRVALASGAMLAAILIARRGHFDSNDPLVLALGLSPLVLFFASGLVLVLSWRQSTGPGAGSRALSTCGKYSYGLYVFHQPVLLAIGKMREALPRFIPGIQIVTFALGLGSTFLLALGSWHLIEKRAVALKRHFQ